MKCVLIHPPFCDPSCPPLGVAYLASALKAKNIDYSIEDANLDFLDCIESSKWLEKCIHANDKKPTTADIDFVSSYLPFLPNEHNENGNVYYSAFRKQQTAFQLTNHAFQDFDLIPYQIKLTNWEKLEQSLPLSIAEKSLFIEWLKHSNLLEKILSQDPDLIGLSVNFEGQLFAAYAISHKLKNMTGATIIWGGGLLNSFKNYLGSSNPIWTVVDGIVLGAGEKIISSLNTSNRRLNTPLHSVWSDNKWISEQKKKLTPPRPDFDLFPLRSYRTIKRILPYRIFSSCSWKKCTFCADGRFEFHHDNLFGDVNKVANELINLAEQYKVSGFYFLDAELPSNFLLALSDVLKKRKDLLRWGGNVRLSPLLAQSENSGRIFAGGGRFFRFGLESASDNILKSMRKGINSSLAERVIRTTNDAGIVTHLYFMHGFPGETKTDWKTSADFLNRNLNYIDSCSFSKFELYEGSPLETNSHAGSITYTANDKNWSYPKLHEISSSEDFEPQTFEDELYSKKRNTRCFPTTADTIFMAEKAPYYFNNPS